jgi:hypothetical protein
LYQFPLHYSPLKCVATYAALGFAAVAARSLKGVAVEFVVGRVVGEALNDDTRFPAAAAGDIGGDNKRELDVWHRWL